MADLRRSLIINFFSNSGATLLKFAVSVIVARILSPSEIGVFSMTYVFVTIAGIFRDFGVSTYIQREPELTVDKIRSAFGVALLTSWLIAALMAAGSHLIADWFGEPGMVAVMQVLALGFVLIPFGSIANALLTREFAAGKQALVNAVGTVAFCVSCVGLAMAGYGALSMAWANLINIAACALMYIPLRPKGLPRLPSFTHWRGVVHFGVGSLVSNCAVAVNNAVPDVLLGKLGSARLVGLFSRANSTVTIFTHVAGSTVSYGAVAYLSQAHHRGEPMAPIMARATVLLTGVGWTALALTAVLGRDITMALYGANWLGSVPAILPLSLAAAVAMMFHYIPMGLSAIGRPYLGALPVLATVAARVAAGWLLWDGTLVTFAWAILLATVLAAPITAWQQQRYCGFPMATLLKALAPSAGVALVTGAAAYGLALLLPASLPALARLLAMALPLALLWYGALRVTGHPVLEEVHRMGQAIGARLLRRKGAATQ